MSGHQENWVGSRGEVLLNTKCQSISQDSFQMLKTILFVFFPNVFLQKIFSKGIILNASLCFWFLLQLEKPVHIRGSSLKPVISEKTK